jgi:nitrate reductase delta subunit
MKNTIMFDGLASILAYPREDYKSRLITCLEALRTSEFPDPDRRQSAIDHLQQFCDAVMPLSVGELEELYTRTFDINPVSSLEVGWHLYGETYERGAFLVQMRDLLRRYAIEESSELPDHLTHALHALGRMDESEIREFVPTRLARALDKMLEGFAVNPNPYEHVLQATRILARQSVTVQEGV